MSKSIVRCRCGHQVLMKEVLRTDFYEGMSGREMVYVKYRCRRCKRLGETFIPESQWDWSIFQAPRNEMNDTERDRFLDKKTINAGDVLTFQHELKEASTLSELMNQGEGRPRSKGDAPKGRPSNGESSSELRRRPGS